MRALGLMDLPHGAFGEKHQHHGHRPRPPAGGHAADGWRSGPRSHADRKECHNGCAIREATGQCVMPTDGIFAVVRTGGTVRAGDGIRVEE
jgi:hypothetical protein